jgi:6,7-dimethyl-8-ribityllumazine synthase
MSGVNTFDTDLKGKGLRIGIAASRFNEAVVRQLVDGALAALKRAGVGERDITLVRVPGAWELPLAARKLAAKGRCDAVIALGCVIRGDTPHFEYVAGECARGLMDVQRERGVPVAFGVLTVENEAQALERADVKRMNKGAEAALAAIEMANLMKELTLGRKKRGTRDGT